MKLPSKEWMIAQVKKKFHIRVSILSLFLAVWLIVDELVKEGYDFNPVEVANPFSHEFWVVVLLLLAAINYIIYRLKGGDKNGA